MESVDRTGCSPSPRPSPLGKGKIGASLLKKLHAPNVQRSDPSASLSPRERAGVRGKEPFKHGWPFLSLTVVSLFLGAPGVFPQDAAPTVAERFAQADDRQQAGVQRLSAT